ncbi:MAG: hypothetical protein WAN36_13495 [Calditrichia bacterium]
MKNWQSYLTQKYADIRTRRNRKELNREVFSYPFPAKFVENVIVVLPLDRNIGDSAMGLVQKLRRHFTHWRFLVLNINRLSQDKLNRFKLPDDKFVNELKNNHFHLALDLNFDFDIRTAYLINMLKIPHRLHLTQQEGNYYNLVMPTNRENFQSFDYVLHSLANLFPLEKSEQE